jgi:hypothetical protein
MVLKMRFPVPFFRLWSFFGLKGWVVPLPGLVYQLVHGLLRDRKAQIFDDLCIEVLGLSEALKIPS